MRAFKTAHSAFFQRKGDRAHSDLIVTPSLHDLPVSFTHPWRDVLFISPVLTYRHKTYERMYTPTYTYIHVCIPSLRIIRVFACIVTHRHIHFYHSCLYNDDVWNRLSLSFHLTHYSVDLSVRLNCRDTRNHFMFPLFCR